MNIIYVGHFGSGKTYLAVRDAVLDKGDYIYTNQPIDQERLNEYQDKPNDKVVVEYEEIKDLKNTICGMVLLDEAQDSVSSHEKTGDIPANFKKIFRQQRKLDVDFVMTTHRVKDIAPYFRSTTKEVRVVRQLSFPLIGFIWRKSVRPSMRCSVCGRLKRDGRGDDSHWLKRALGFGTFYRYSVYPPDIIEDVSSADAAEVADEKCIGTGYRLFNIDVANLYDTNSIIDKETGKTRLGDNIEPF